MNKLSIAALALALCASSAFAMDTNKVPAGVVAKSSTTTTGKTTTTTTAPADATISASCEAKAIDKNGKALSGAAKAASIKKCGAETSTAIKPAEKMDNKMGKMDMGKMDKKADLKADVKAAGVQIDTKAKAGAKTEAKPTMSAPEAACETKAVSKDGKALYGAAKASSVKKCVADAKK